MDEHQDAPLVVGGQGRTEESLRNDAHVLIALGAVGVACVIGGLVLWLATLLSAN